MTVEQKAKQLALTLVGEDQTPEPLIEALVKMAVWQRKQVYKEIFSSEPPAKPRIKHDRDDL